MTVIIDISFKKSDRSKRVVLEEGQDLVIGRSNEDVLMTSDPRLSRKHFRISHQAGCIELEHLSRTNPTLVAAENSSDFQKLRGSESYQTSCRIIAGFHRFVVTLETAETLEHSPMPEFNVASSWSDMDDDESDNDPIIQPAVSPTRATRPDSGARFSFDDSVDNEPAPNRAARKNQREPISFESEFQPVDRAPQINSTRPNSKQDRQDRPANHDSKATDVDESHSITQRENNRSPQVSKSKKRDSFISFSDTDDVETDSDSGTKKPSKADKKKKSKSADKSDDQSGFPKKLNFPVADNFFDD